MEGRPSDPPGAVSNQNEEEAESGLRRDRSHPEPRTTDGGAEGKGESPETGASGEGSQSSGHPENAG
jgi:hypothetical protein